MSSAALKCRYINDWFIPILVAHQHLQEFSIAYLQEKCKNMVMRFQSPLVYLKIYYLTVHYEFMLRWTITCLSSISNFLSTVNDLTLGF